jgi:hypothetical protein
VLATKIADQPLLLDGDADPGFVVDKGSAGPRASSASRTRCRPSPFGTGDCTQDKDKCFGLCPLVADANEPDGDKQIGCSLVPKMGLKTGFAHEMWAKGDVPPEEFATRPFILQWSDRLLPVGRAGRLRRQGRDPRQRRRQNLEFAVIVRPQP